MWSRNAPRPVRETGIGPVAGSATSVNSVGAQRCCANPLTGEPPPDGRRTLTDRVHSSPDVLLNGEGRELWREDGSRCATVHPCEDQQRKTHSTGHDRSSSPVRPGRGMRSSGGTDGAKEEAETDVRPDGSSSSASPESWRSPTICRCSDSGSSADDEGAGAETVAVSCAPERDGAADETAKFCAAVPPIKTTTQTASTAVDAEM